MQTIIGIDCATQPEKTGMALAHLDEGVVSVDKVALGSKRTEANMPKAIITEWIEKSLADHQRVLIALDAPLGWPASLGPALIPHRAGDAIGIGPDQLFRRRTDDEIQRTLKKRPLEVGADHIARTAHAALKLLEELRQGTGFEVPLAWDPQESAQVVAIEVYPAATLLARDIRNPANALEVLQLKHGLSFGELKRDSLSPDERDAVLCALAGADFLRDLSVAPSDNDRETAKKEGWIWVWRKESDKRA